MPGVAGDEKVTCERQVALKQFKIQGPTPEVTYLDRMKPGQAFLGTRNLDLGSLTERFETRFQSVRLQAPENEVFAAFLARRWSAPITITRQIAEGSQGNVRAALADLEMWMG
jgi:hypothetical protein